MLYTLQALEVVEEKISQFLGVQSGEETSLERFDRLESELKSRSNVEDSQVLSPENDSFAFASKKTHVDLYPREMQKLQPIIRKMVQGIWRRRAISVQTGRSWFT